MATRGYITDDAESKAISAVGVNPSMEEVWNTNYDSARRSYEQDGHLSNLPISLKRWMTYQRHHAKTLTDDQLRRLDEIRYKDCPVVRKGDEALWEEQFSVLQERKKEKKRHLRTFDRGLSSWLTRQRRAFSEGILDSSRQERLERLGVCLVLDKSKRNTSKITVANQRKWLEKLDTR